MSDVHTIKDAMRERRLVQVRILLLAVLIALMAGVLAWRYYHLQVVNHRQYATLAEENRIHVRSVPPSRGLIFDRNGVLLAENRPSHTLSIVRERVVDMQELLSDLDQLLQLSEREKERFADALAQYHRPYEGIPLRFQLNEEELARIAVHQYRLPGIDIETELVRYYPHGELVAHSVGYVGRINEQDKARIDPVDYAGTHVIGKVGVEQQYEESLHGEVGYEYVETDARGRVLRVLERHSPAAGENIQLYMDIRLQQALQEILAGRRAAAAVVEVETGGILAMVSVPSYDPNLFVTGISSANYAALLEDPDRPLFNRLLQGQYPPGSTIKPAYGLSALASNTIDPGFRVNDPGFFRLPGNTHQYRDWKAGGHGTVDLRKAIQESCDTFFYEVGVRMGIDTLSRYGQQFGIGVSTGIDLPQEKSGVMPSQQWKNGARGVSWYPGDTVNTAIGQGFTLMTPLQMAQMTAILARRGEILPLRMARQIGEQPYVPQATGRVEASAAAWDLVHEAMVSVVHEPRGTAQAIGRTLEAYRMAGKTGTAQVVGIAQGEKYNAAELAERQWDHALFVAFAPAGQPEIAIGLIVENGEHGSSAAAPVAREIFDEYFRLKALDAAAAEQDLNEG